jgi:hypothetical protein
LSLSPHGLRTADRLLLGAISIGVIVGFALLLAWAPEPNPTPRHWLRVVGGGLCLAAVTVALATRDELRGASRRRRFISEVLAACRLPAAYGPPTAIGWWGSLAANLLMAGGAIVFLFDARELAGPVQAGVVATAAALLSVVLVYMLPVDDPVAAAPLAFAHPIAAATFYVSAAVLSWIERGQLGRFGQVFAALHIASSSGLIVLAVVASWREYGWRPTAWPPIGIRILLDTSPKSRARWVRRWQWSATFIAGLALALGALGW